MNQVFSKIDIESMYAADTNGITFNESLKYAIVGSDVDDRCRVALRYLEQRYKIIRISYDSDNFIVLFDDKEIDANDFPDFIGKMDFGDGEVLIDTTTVNVPELLLLIGAFYENNIRHYSALYLEPSDYSHLQKNEMGSDRKFELSKRYEGYKGIPGYVLKLDIGDSVAFFCGYEPERIQNAFEFGSISSSYAYLLFGMPPYNAGWDMNSYENHIKFIDTQSIKNISFCGATNPLAVIKKLDEMYASISDDDKLFIAPLGTKPMSLGACLFVVVSSDRERVALLFDHPVKKPERTKDFGNWHLYNINIL
jgi:hypothetical protein